jgi:hypothetical protein
MSLLYTIYRRLSRVRSSFFQSFYGIIRKVFVRDFQVLIDTEVMNANKVAFVAVVAILKHIAGSLAKPCTLLDRHGEHWVIGVGGGEVFFDGDEFHV